jgi:hypothetical protein
VASADGRYITAASFDYSLRIWDSANGKVVRDPARWSGKQKESSAIALAPNGLRVAFIGEYDVTLVFEVLYIDDRGIALEGPLTLAGYWNAGDGHGVLKERAVAGYSFMGFYFKDLGYTGCGGTQASSHQHCL